MKPQALTEHLRAQLIAVLAESSEEAEVTRLAGIAHRVDLALRAVDPDAIAAAARSFDVAAEVRELAARCEEITTVRTDLAAGDHPATVHTEAVALLEDSVRGVRARINQIDRYQEHLWRLHLERQPMTPPAGPTSPADPDRIELLLDRARDLAALAAGDDHLTADDE